MRVKGILLTALALGFTAAALAATTVTLTDTSQTTTLTANVAEQATVTVPAGVTFTVNNVTTSTVATNATVTVIDIVLNDGKKLKISLQANNANFTAPAGGTVTWAAGDVSWNAATWSSSGVGTATSLSSAAFNTVATSATNAADCSTTNLVFTLQPKTTVDRAGSHTLAVTWKFESI